MRVRLMYLTWPISKRILQNLQVHFAWKILFNCKSKDFESQLPYFKSFEANLSLKPIENN